MSSVKLFGEHNGKTVFLIKLANESIEAEFISFGATLRSLKVKDRDGNTRDIVLGYDSAQEYAANDGYIGAAVGRHANRIGGSRFELNGKVYLLSSNEGANQLHGGIEGFSHKLWSFSCTENSVTFSLESPDGDEGYPGNLRTELTYSIEDCCLRLDYKAHSDKDTLVNLTNHAYFNLGGHDSGNIYGHTLRLGAESYTKCGDGNIPTGEIVPVNNTPLDFRKETGLEASLKSCELSETCGIDHNFVLSASPAAVLFCPDTGIELRCRTSMEGLQVYSCGFLTERNGKGGATYAQHHAICLETQHFPDAINKPHFPSPILRAGEEYSEWTEYSFFIR